MPELYKTSRWTRFHDWDWLRAPMVAGQEGFARKRAASLPSRFYYHVLKLVTIAASEADPAEVETTLSYANYHPLVEHILAEHATPRPLDHCESGSWLRDYGAEPIQKAVAAVRSCGLLVPATAEEPVDCAAAFLAATMVVGILQNGDELIPALGHAAALEPKAVLEIGTAWGGTLYTWAQMADPNALLISVDIGPAGGGYPKAYVPRLRQFCGPTQRLHCVEGDSTTSAVREEVEQVLAGRSVDLLFIDGDHSYEGAKSDFDTFSKFVRPGGMVVFHDIRLSDIAADRPEVRDTWGTSVAEDAPMIDALWEEIKHDFRHEEYVVESGVGVLWMGE